MRRGVTLSHPRLIGLTILTTLVVLPSVWAASVVEEPGVLPAAAAGSEPFGQARAVAAPTEPPEVTWYLNPHQVPSDGFNEIYCGRAGWFYFSFDNGCPDGIGNCHSGEKLAYYEKSNTLFNHPSYDVFSQVGPGLGQAVAVLDVSDSEGTGHAEAVGATIKEISGLEVVLYDLAEQIRGGEDLQYVTDLQMADKLCRLIRDVEDSNAPFVSFNISMVRSDGNSEEAPCSQQDALGGALGELIDHITGTLGLMGMGSAGNFPNKLPFPACHPSMTSVASVDPALLSGYREMVLAWESPRPVDAMAGGAGLCLKLPGDAQKNSSVEPHPSYDPAPLPNGASFATALFTGAVSYVLTHYLVPSPDQGQWFIDPETTDLVRDLGAIRSRWVIPGVEYWQLMQRLLTADNSDLCLPTEGLTDPTLDIIKLGAPQLYPEELTGVDPLPSAFIGTAIPSPSPMPCGACPGNVVPTYPKSGESSDWLIVNMSGAVALENATLETVLVRCGDYFQVPEDDGKLAGIIGKIGAAGITAVAFESFNRRSDQESVSLIAIIDVQGKRVWSSTPVFLLDM